MQIFTVSVHNEGDTLLHVSKLINKVLDNTVSITIVDGQNEESIANQSDSAQHPCLPTTIHSDKRINVTFSSNITSFGDCFPPICANREDTATEYMFDGAQQWTIHNLIVQNYDSGHGYGLVRSDSVHADIACIGCTFSNITNTTLFREIPLVILWVFGLCGAVFPSFGQCAFGRKHVSKL